MNKALSKCLLGALFCQYLYQYLISWGGYPALRGESCFPG